MHCEWKAALQASGNTRLHTSSGRPFLESYNVLRGTLNCHDEALRIGLADLGIGARFEWVEVRWHRKQEDAIYSNWFGRSTIVAGENVKDGDKKPFRSTFPSEALWQSFQLSQGHVP